MTPDARLNSQHHWYTLDLAFVQRHIPHLLCRLNCTHPPCLSPVVYVRCTDPRGPGRPKISTDEARVIITATLHALQRSPMPVRLASGGFLYARLTGCGT